MNGTVLMHDGTVEVRGSCERCGGAWALALPARAWHRWRSGVMALDTAFPGMGQERRAALVEGICRTCHAALVTEAEAG